MDSQEALDVYLDFLDDTSSLDVTKGTPHIDTVLQQHKRRSTEVNKIGMRCEGTYESRLLTLEQQLTDLLMKSSKSPLRDTDITTTTSITSKGVGSHTDSDQTTPPRVSGKQLPRHVRMKARGGVARQQANISTTQEDRKKKNQLLHESSARKKEEDETCARALNLELDSERERRWKAEQAASRLVVHVRNLQSRLTESDKRQEAAVLQATKIHKELAEEKQASLRLADEKEELLTVVTKGQKEYEELQLQYQKQLKLFRELEVSYNSLEQRKMEKVANLRSIACKSEAMAAGHLRELELLRKTFAQSDSQVRHLQELLVKKDEERQREKDENRPLRNKDVQEMVATQIQQEQVKMAAAQEQLEMRLSDQQQAYQKLEDEFRMALRLEASRYNELERAHREVCDEMEATRQTAVAAVQKEQNAVGVVGELTSLVKELQLKVKDLSRNKQKMESELKDRIIELEAQTVGKNKLEVKLQAAQEENGRLGAKVLAQTSIVDGLREERKLWGQELAHQGASLARERGRLESQVDALGAENTSLREELQKERDAVRIKEKQLEDCAHTVQQLRKAMADSERGREEKHREIQELKRRLEHEGASFTEMQEQLLSLAERKEELKEELVAMQEDKTHWKTKFRELQEQWEAKVDSIGNLEQTLQELHQSFTAKENMLISERDKALDHAKNMEERVKVCDDAFREQLEAKEAAHHAHFSRLAVQKQKEVDLANEKVRQVEEEMRALLEEIAKERTRMEAKVAKLTTVLRDFQHDIVEQATS